MAATKTKPRALASVIASAEEQINADLEALKAEASAIDAQLPAIEQRVSDARDKAGETAEIEVRWLRGEDVPALDYVLAQAEDVKAESLALGLKRKRDALRKRMPADHTIIAEHIRPIFERVLPGVPVYVTNAPARTWMRDIPSETPATVVLVQEPGVTVDPFTSAMSGDVTAYYVRSTLHRSIDVNAVEDSGRALKRPLEVKSHLPADAPQGEPGSATAGPVVDSMRVHVSGVVDGLPIIRKVETRSLVPTWVTAILGAQDIGRANYITGRIESAREWDGPGSWRAMLGSTDVRVYAPKGRELPHDDGTRTITVTNRIMLTGAAPGQFAAALQEQANMHAGSVHAGVGMLESTEVKWEPPANLHTDTFVIDVTQTYRSKGATDEWTKARQREQQEREADAQAKEARRVASEQRATRASVAGR